MESGWVWIDPNEPEMGGVGVFPTRDEAERYMLTRSEAEGWGYDPADGLKGGLYIEVELVPGVWTPK